VMSSQLASATYGVHTREIIKSGLTLDITDPNHMPVTRFLSNGKRTTILNWLILPELLRAEPTAAAQPGAAPNRPMSHQPSQPRSTRHSSTRSAPPTNTSRRSATRRKINND
jgi:hypothetical protein